MSSMQINKAASGSSRLVQLLPAFPFLLAFMHLAAHISSVVMKWMSDCRLSFEKRKDQAQCAMGRRLFDIIIKKQSNLAVAADVTTVADLLSVADKASNLKVLEDPLQ